MSKTKKATIVINEHAKVQVNFNNISSEQMACKVYLQLLIDLIECVDTIDGLVEASVSDCKDIYADLAVTVRTILSTLKVYNFGINSERVLLENTGDEIPITSLSKRPNTEFLIQCKVYIMSVIGSIRSKQDMSIIDRKKTAYGLVIGILVSVIDKI